MPSGKLYTVFANQGTIFGQVTKGMDVVDASAAGTTGAGDRPIEPVSMTTVTVVER